MNYKYVSKPKRVEAFQITEETRRDNKDWPNWLNRAWNKERNTPGSIWPENYPNSDGTDKLCVRFIEAMDSYIIGWGDWLVRYKDGEIWPMGDEEFKSKFKKDRR